MTPLPSDHGPPKKASPTVAAFTVHLPLEAAGELVSYCQRHDVPVEHYIRSTILRRLEAVGRIEGLWPAYPSRDRQRPGRRGNLTPGVY